MQIGKIRMAEKTSQMVSRKRQRSVGRPSPHRRLMFRVAQQLTQDNIDEILFLSDDCLYTIPHMDIEKINSGVGLMRCLERSGKLAPGKYSHLLCCLQDIGRLDLAALITHQNIENAIPHSLSNGRTNYPEGIKFQGLLVKQQTQKVTLMTSNGGTAVDNNFFKQETKLLSITM